MKTLLISFAVGLLVGVLYGVIRVKSPAAINEDVSTASLALAMDVAGYFELDAAKAREVAAEVASRLEVARRSGTARHYQARD